MPNCRDVECVRCKAATWSQAKCWIEHGMCRACAVRALLAARPRCMVCDKLVQPNNTRQYPKCHRCAREFGMALHPVRDRAKGR